MVNTSLPCLVIDIEVLQIVVKVDTSSTEISAKESSMSSEDGGHVDMSLSTQGDSESGLPFVEMSDDGCAGFAGGEL